MDALEAGLKILNDGFQHPEYYCCGDSESVQLNQFYEQDRDACLDMITGKVFEWLSYYEYAIKKEKYDLFNDSPEILYSCRASWIRSRGICRRILEKIISIREHEYHVAIS